MGRRIVGGMSWMRGLGPCEGVGDAGRGEETVRGGPDADGGEGAISPLIHGWSV